MKILIVLVAVAAAAQGFPDRKDDIATAALKNDWNEVHNILKHRFSVIYNLKPLPADVKVVRPQYTGQYPQQYQEPQHQQIQQQYSSQQPQPHQVSQRRFTDDYLVKLFSLLAAQAAHKDGVSSASAAASTKYEPF